MQLPMPDATRDPGIYQTITDTNSSDAIEVPDGAVGVWLWFETASNDTTLIGGQFGTSTSDTSITGLDGTTTDLGQHPAMPTYHQLPNRAYRDGGGVAHHPLYIHVASTVSGAVVRGSFFF